MLPVDPKVELTCQWLRKASGDLTKAEALLGFAPAAANVLDGAVFFASRRPRRRSRGSSPGTIRPARKTHDQVLVQACEAVDPGKRVNFGWPLKC